MCTSYLIQDIPFHRLTVFAESLGTFPGSMSSQNGSHLLLVIAESLGAFPRTLRVVNIHTLIKAEDSRLRRVTRRSFEGCQRISLVCNELTEGFTRYGKELLNQILLNILLCKNSNLLDGCERNIVITNVLYCLFDI